jgi:hypothetical protein
MRSNRPACRRTLKNVPGLKDFYHTGKMDESTVAPAPVAASESEMELRMSVAQSANLLDTVTVQADEEAETVRRYEEAYGLAEAQIEEAKRQLAHWGASLAASRGRLSKLTSEKAHHRKCLTTFKLELDKETRKPPPRKNATRKPPLSKTANTPKKRRVQ